jgi:hypothetical protein
LKTVSKVLKDNHKRLKTESELNFCLPEEDGSKFSIVTKDRTAKFNERFEKMIEIFISNSSHQFPEEEEAQQRKRATKQNRKSQPTQINFK